MDDCTDGTRVTPPRGDTPAAIDFLTHWDRSGPWGLVAIKPDGPVDGRCFYPDEADQAAAWIDGRQGVRNIYFHVNRPRDKFVGKRDEDGRRCPKATKSDIRDALAMHVDVDPRPGHDRPAERARILADLRGYDPPPSVIVDSGNGYGGYWRIPPWPDITQIEQRNKFLAETLGGDPAGSIEHLMRLPGTLNIPTRTKLARGYPPVPTLARVVEANWLYLHDPERSFAPLPPEGGAEQEFVWPDWLPIEDLLNPDFIPNLVDGPTPPGAVTEQEAAIDSIASAIHRVSITTENRNNKIAQEAFLCGALLAASGLTEDDVHQHLFEAIPGADRNRRKDADTIRRQLREGQRKPGTNDPRIKELHRVAHELLDLSPPVPTYRAALRIYNDEQPNPLSSAQVEKIASRAAEVHNVAAR